MITNRQRYEARHAQICERAERQYFAQKEKTPQFNVRQAIGGYAISVRAAIARKDGTGIAGAHAAAAAHLALREGRVKQKAKRRHLVSERPTLHLA
jgi:hypothetical protein